MKLYRYFAAVTLITFSIAWSSCSTTSEVTQKGQRDAKASSVYPSWYDGNRSFAADSMAYRAYGTALASDSAAAAEKAVAKARSELKSGVSRTLEALRKKALEELGKSSGLASTGFIVTLRNAETTVPEAAETAHVEVEANEGHSGYRGFAEVAAKRQSLLRQLDDAMSRYRTAWGRMKGANAFSGF